MVDTPTPTLVDVTKANDDLATRLVATVKNLAARLHSNNQCVEAVVAALETAHAAHAKPVEQTSTVVEHPAAPVVEPAAPVHGEPEHQG